MKRVLTALAIGAFAGVIDALPMLLQGLDYHDALVALFHWTVLGLIIPFVYWNIVPWLKGLIIAELSAIPILILSIQKGADDILLLILATALLGVFVGILGSKLVPIPHASELDAKA